MNLEKSPQLFSVWYTAVVVVTDNLSEYKDYVLFWETLISILKNVEIEASSSNY